MLFNPTINYQVMVYFERTFLETLFIFLTKQAHMIFWMNFFSFASSFFCGYMRSNSNMGKLGKHEQE